MPFSYITKEKNYFQIATLQKTKNHNNNQNKTKYMLKLKIDFLRGINEIKKSFAATLLKSLKSLFLVTLMSYFLKL